MFGDYIFKVTTTPPKGPLSFWLVTSCTAPEEICVTIIAAIGIVQAKQDAYIAVLCMFW